MDVPAVKRARAVAWPNIKGGIKDTLANGAVCMRWKLRGDASLLWCPWPEGVHEPEFGEGGHYRIMQVYGAKEQPRLSKCFDHTYDFSGQTHPVEAVTPDEIKALYVWANAAMGCGQGDEGFNMNLCNYYPTGWHCINAHSDDKRQFGKVDHVACFVTGTAARKIEIRDKETKQMVLNGPLPSGFYCMAGRDFQEYYTHAFPRLHEALFKHVVENGPTWFGAEHWPADLSNARLAQWLAAHGEEVRQHLDPKRAAKWTEWLQPRTSHTLRNFVVEK